MSTYTMELDEEGEVIFREVGICILRYIKRKVLNVLIARRRKLRRFDILKEHKNMSGLLLGLKILCGIKSKWEESRFIVPKR